MPAGNAHRLLSTMFDAFTPNIGPGELKDPGSGGTIKFETYWGLVCSVVTTTAEARTLAQPDRVGIMGTVSLSTDGGDLTLTVTGGYNQGADTVITLADAGDFVTFISIKVGSSYYWRVYGKAEELVIPSTSASSSPSTSASASASTSPSTSASASPSTSASASASTSPSTSASASASTSPSTSASTSPSAS